MLTRRQLLKVAALSSASPLFSGCWPFTRRPKSPCQVAPPNLGQPLTIDAHCHIFNGSDLDAKDFFDKVVLNEKGILGVVSHAIGAILQDLVWTGAPSGDDELAMLAKFAGCPSETQKSALIKQHHDERYTAGRNALLQTKALSAAPKSGTQKFSQPHTAAEAVTQDDVLAQMRDRLQSASRDEYKAARDTTFSAPHIAPKNVLAATATANVLTSIAAALDYVLENFQYRYGAVQDYLATYANPDRSIDLMLASMVDYDWWLSQGCSPPTNLGKQVAVMSKISVITRGQVHGFVPFDPLREVAFYAGEQPPNSCHNTPIKRSSLDLVQDAIQNQGCLGVKLYPPMGFAAYGNAGWPSSFWHQPWLPTWMASDNIPSSRDNRKLPIGQRLDDALASLYTWCCQNDVPVMAHSDASNGVIQEFKDLACPEYWGKVIGSDPWRNLRISFGHLGGFADQNPAPGSPPAQFIALMGQDSNAYADAAYFSEVLDESGSLKAEIIAQYKAAPVLPSRLMYGTDWNLLINFGQIKPYLADFISIFNDIDKATASHASQQFFGSNAAEWIGLKKGMPARKRVTDFYKKNGLNPDSTPPTWMQKLDSMP